jgi:hypothetical protein
MSGSSQVQHCVLESVEGKKVEECSERTESDECIGLRRSAEFSQRKSFCKTSVSSNCIRWGHLNNTDTSWVAVASYHQRKLERCLETEYGPLEKGGIEAIKRDLPFMDWLAGLDDGGSAFGLKKSGFIMALLEGATFREAVLGSPVGSTLTPGNAVAYRDAIDEGDSSFETGSARPPSSLSKETEGPPDVKKKNRRRSLASNANGEASDPTMGSIAIPTIVYRAPTSLAPPTPVSIRSRQKSPYSLGLDRSLFEQISAAYQKRETELVGTEYFLRKISPLNAPKDLSDALKRGTGL